jgi:hypothetical protein
MPPTMNVDITGDQNTVRFDDSSSSNVSVAE